MSKRITNLSTFLLILLLLLPITSFAQSSVTVGKVRLGEIDCKGFKLTSKTEIKISGEGAVFDRWDDNLQYYGWILNSDTRDVVWHLMEDYYKWDDDEGVFNFSEKLTLEAGEYEVYYTAMEDNDVSIHSFGDLLDGIFGNRERNRDRRYRDEMHMTVDAPSGKMIVNDGKEVVDKMAKDAIVSFTRMRDDEYVKKGFTLTGDTKIQIYGLGEGRRSDTNDYGWISDVKNNKRVWTMSARFADNAGGGDKNFLVDEEITLPAGTYMVYYITDDSHSYEKWNVLPPDDPQFWGITLWAVSKDQMANVKPFQEGKEREAVVELIKVRDDRTVSKGITLKKSMDLRILCLGEESSGREMADYGWIVNADTKETVWEMEKRETEHAGGASKNRMVDQIINLEKGNYIVYYATDGSHSYDDWNSSPPYDKTRWGISIWTVNENDADDVTSFDADDYQSKDVIAQIVRVRDDEYIKKSFTLNKDTKVRIIALGEGTKYDMSDYGWIKNDDTRKVVWEMTYRKTEHAGGASKNRMFNGTMILEAGEYTLYFETDGSHSYRDWNSTPPQNPEMYGITIMREK